MSTSLAVIVPCYNDGEFLHRSLPSAFGQLQPGDELIVVDDGSTDNTGAVCHEYSEQYGERLRYLRQDNQGVSTARNHGIDTARADYVVFLDADDELVDGALDAFRRYLPGGDRDTGADMLIGGHEWLRDGSSRTRLPELHKSAAINFRNFLTKKTHLGNLSCFCIRRSALQDIRFNTELTVSEDFVLILLLLANCQTCAVPHIISRVHRREGSLRSQGGLDHVREQAVNDALFNHPALPVSFQACRKTADIRNDYHLLRIHWRQRDGKLYQQVFRHLVQLRPLAWVSKWGMRYIYLRAAERSRG